MKIKSPKTRTSQKQNLIARYNCGPVKLSGDHNAFYERHVTFDQVVPELQTSDRDKFEAIARSVRDVLSQRWVKTEQTYQERNAKRVYYLSMEFLLGRALDNNIANLLILPEAQEFARHHGIDPLDIIAQEPDPGLGNGGLGRLAACFLDSMATLGIPGMCYGLRYEYGIFLAFVSWSYHTNPRVSRREEFQADFQSASRPFMHRSRQSQRKRRLLLLRNGTG